MAQPSAKLMVVVGCAVGILTETESSNLLGAEMSEPMTWEEMEEFAKQLADKVNGNAPIAWYNADESSLSFKNHGGGWQPLYTHPAKAQEK
jgi:ABC-type glycerol-3-phosphate transport system substrate-binding protein